MALRPAMPLAPSRSRTGPSVSPRADSQRPQSPARPPPTGTPRARDPGPGRLSRSAVGGARPSRPLTGQGRSVLLVSAARSRSAGRPSPACDRCKG